MALPVQVRFEEPPLDLALYVVGESVAGAGKVLRDHALSPPLLGFDYRSPESSEEGGSADRGGKRGPRS